MKFSKLGAIFVLLLAAVVSISGVVHNIPVVQYQIPKSLARHRNVQREPRGKEILHGLIPESAFNSRDHLISSRISNKPFVGVTRFNTTKRVHQLVGNITIGTPAQTFSVEYCFFYGSDLTVIDSNATYHWPTYSYTNQQKFNTSNSSTYAPQGRTFSTWLGSGSVGSDTANISGVVANVAFGVVNYVGLFFSSFQVDGMVGLSAWNSTANVSTNLLSQLAPQLDTPVVSLWSNRTYEGNGTAQITLGAVDTTNCRDNWAFAPRLNSYYYATNATSFVATAANGTVVGRLQNLNQLALAINDGWWHSIASRNVFDLITNATGAVWNSTLKQWTTSCNVSQIGNILVNLGNDNQASNPVTLSAADLIDYLPDKNVCFVNVDNWGGNATYGYLVLARVSLDTHCVAYNVSTNQFGWADSLLAAPIEASQPDGVDTPSASTVSGNGGSSASSGSGGNSGSSDGSGWGYTTTQASNPFV